MFFDLLLLRKPGSNFYIPWNVATRGIKSVKAPDIFKVNISRLCDDIKEYYTSENQDPKAKNRFSLRLTTILVNGTIKIYQAQVISLECEVITLLTRERIPRGVRKPRKSDESGIFQLPPTPVAIVRRKTKAKKTVLSLDFLENLDQLVAQQIITTPQVLAARQDEISIREEAPRPVVDVDEGFGPIGVESLPVSLRHDRDIAAAFEALDFPTPIAPPPEIHEVQVHREAEVKVPQVPTERERLRVVVLEAILLPPQEEIAVVEAEAAQIQPELVPTVVEKPKTPTKRKARDEEAVAEPRTEIVPEAVEPKKKKSPPKKREAKKPPTQVEPQVPLSEIPPEETLAPPTKEKTPRPDVEVRPPLAEIQPEREPTREIRPPPPRSHIKKHIPRRSRPINRCSKNDIISGKENVVTQKQPRVEIKGNPLNLVTILDFLYDLDAEARREREDIPREEPLRWRSLSAMTDSRRTDSLSAAERSAQMSELGRPSTLGRPSEPSALAAETSKRRFEEFSEEETSSKRRRTDEVPLLTFPGLEDIRMDLERELGIQITTEAEVPRILVQPPVPAAEFAVPQVPALEGPIMPVPGVSEEPMVPEVHPREILAEIPKQPITFEPIQLPEQPILEPPLIEEQIQPVQEVEEQLERQRQEQLERLRQEEMERQRREEIDRQRGAERRRSIETGERRRERSIDSEDRERSINSQRRQERTLQLVRRLGKVTLEDITERPFSKMKMARAFYDVLVLRGQQKVKLIPERHSIEIKFILDINRSLTPHESPESHSSDNNLSENNNLETQSSEIKPVESKSLKSRSIESRSSESRSSESDDSESKIPISKLLESKRLESKSSESKPSKMKPLESKSSEIGSSESNSSQNEHLESKSS